MPDRHLEPRERAAMRDLPRRFKDHAAAVVFLAMLVAFVATVLVPGYRLANELSASTAALKLVSEQRGHPDAMMQSLVAVRDRLGAGSYLGEAIRNLDAQLREYDAALAELQRTVASNSAELGKAASIWSQYRRILEPVVGYSGIPYVDSDALGTRMNPGGRALLADTRRALDFGRVNTPGLNAAMASIGAGLERDSVTGAATLRRLMIAGVAFAVLLIGLLAYFQWRKTREEDLAREARQQTQEILGTVKEGLFLLDSDLRIGKAYSAALSTLFRRDHFDGLAFEDLLRDLVTDATLATATKYVKLLWGDRANENLIRSINPLAEVEVTIDQGPAGRDTRYLEFDFHRVRRDGNLRQILVSVSDVTSRVLLGRELKDSQDSASTQLDMLLGILQVEPDQLAAFLSNSYAALRMVNTVLKVPAKSDAEFRNKLDVVFREIHKVKGEASALGLGSFESRAHVFEDLLQGLRERPNLSGNDFLPLVVRLDDLFGHLTSIQDLIGRLDGLRCAARLNATPPVPGGSGLQAASPPAASDLAGTLDSLAQRVAAQCGKQVRLVARGLEHVPDEYRKAVREVAIQFVRNSVVHGIEEMPVRRGLGKDETGELRLEFRLQGRACALDFQDDGAGIVAERVREAAVRRGLLAEEQARALDQTATLGLIFKSGFSTRDGADRDSGRGVGLDIVRKTVRDLGGKVAVATTPGRFTRFRVLLPEPAAQENAVA
jgi:signal transduction histidine kinase